MLLFFETIEEKSNTDIAFEAIKQFIVPEIPEAVLKTIVEDTLNFDFPVVKNQRRYFYFRAISWANDGI